MPGGGKYETHNKRKMFLVGDGEYAVEYECSCDCPMEVIFSNGSCYGEEAGNFTDITPPIERTCVLSYKKYWMRLGHKG
jgi:hypothetical protein